jgi:TM2 domain-containing membrane protein YozV
MFCPRCGQPNLDGALYCRHCSARLPEMDQPKVIIGAERSPGIAAVLSFFWCGLGQIYNGRIIKGVILMMLYGLSWLMIHSIVLLPVGVICAVILWFYGMINAYREAERINRSEAARVH